MKLNRKMKLALGLGLGTIVSTAAIATIAVSCSESGTTANGVTYNPASELKDKISQKDLDVIYNNLNTELEKQKRQLESIVQQNAKIESNNSYTSVKLEGTILEIEIFFEIKISAPNNIKQHLWTKAITKFDLKKDSDNKYTHSFYQEIKTGTGNNEQPPVDITSKIELEELKEAIQKFYKTIN